MISTTQGIRVACLGGIYESNIYAAAEEAHVCHRTCATTSTSVIEKAIRSQGFTSPYFTAQTVEKLLANTLTTSKPQDQNYTSLAAIKATAAASHHVDILISNAWPAGITHFSGAPLPVPELASIGVEPVAEVVRQTKPRYHFAAGGGKPPRFWEREPFIWDDENGQRSDNTLREQTDGGDDR